MSPTNNDLLVAYNNSQLPRLGYTFQSALDCDALKTCLVRMAIIMQKPARIVLPRRTPAPHWTDQY